MGKVNKVVIKPQNEKLAFNGQYAGTVRQAGRQALGFTCSISTYIFINELFLNNYIFQTKFICAQYYLFHWRWTYFFA
jgi:hypothetical protein